MTLPNSRIIGAALALTLVACGSEEPTAPSSAVPLESRAAIVELASIEPSSAHTQAAINQYCICLLYTSPSPRDVEESRMPSSA